MKRHEDAYGSVVDPFLDAVTGAPFQASDEGCIVKDAVKQLARGSHSFLRREQQ